MKKHLLVILLAVFSAALLTACATASTPISTNTPNPTNTPKLTDTPQPTNTPEPTKTPAPTNTPAPTETPAPTDTPEPTNTPTATPNPNAIGPGTYLVGQDIKPGLYKGQEANCYWERMSSLDGSLTSILANDNSKGQFYVQVLESDKALKVDCDMVRLDPLPEHSGEYPTSLKAGDYLVGIDIQPGTYKGQEADCYWARLNSLDGSLASILANDNSKGQFYIQVQKSDKALSVGCDVELTQ